jgi:transposase
MSSRGPYRRHTSQFKLQLCQQIRSARLAGARPRRSTAVSEPRAALADAVRLSELDGEEAEASVSADYEAKIAALERRVVQLTMELDLLKKRRACASSAAATARRSSAARRLLHRTWVQSDRAASQHVLLPAFVASARCQR